MLDKIAFFSKEMQEEVKKEYRHLTLTAIDSMGFLTYRCTSMCKTCNIWQRTKKEPTRELSKEEWLTVMARIRKYGLRSFEIFGGDALLRKDCTYTIIKYCSSNGIKTYFPTNGNLCDLETVKALIDSGLHTVYLSIDDIGKDHDDIRGMDGTFDRIKKALDDFIEVRGTRQEPKIIICSTLSSLNFRKFPQIVEFLAQCNIDVVYPRIVGEFRRENILNSEIDGAIPEPYFASSDDSSHLLGRKNLDEFKTIINDIKKNPPDIDVNFRTFYTAKDKTLAHGIYDFKKCHVATTFVTINPNGDVVPCPFFKNYIIGNLVEQDLDEIWGNAKHKKFVRLQQHKKIPLCLNCNMRVYYPSMLETFEYYYKRLLSISTSKVC